MAAITSSPLALEPAGRVSYGVRAFEQDAQEAMRGDIIRGIIEAVTNSDDSYAQIHSNQIGKIRVEVEHRRGTPSNVTVRDRASGMSLDELRTKIAELGNRTSGFEQGAAVRGNLGRGAKDLAAFGPVLFESIKNDHSTVPSAFNRTAPLRLFPQEERRNQLIGITWGSRKETAR